MNSILFRRNNTEAVDALILELWEHGTVGIIEETAGLRAFFEDDRDLSALLDVHSDSIHETRREQGLVAQAIPGEWDPVLAGTSFFIVPSCSNEPAPPGRMRLALETTTAFGSGRHESTQLVIEALEQLLRPGQTVLDVGCGSGILMSAAALLGAGQLFGCDIHPDAIRAAQKQIQCPLFLGAADAVESGVADLVLANISASVVDTLAFDLNRATKSSGFLVISGFVQQNPPERYTPDMVLRKGEWLCWICRPRQTAEHGPVQPFNQQWW